MTANGYGSHGKRKMNDETEPLGATPGNDTSGLIRVTREWGSGLAITQPLGQSTIMPWPLGLACSGAVHAVACGGSGGGSSLGNSGRAVDQARGRQPLSGAEKRNV